MVESTVVVGKLWCNIDVRIVVALLVFAACDEDRPDPPFAFRVRVGSSFVVEEHYPNYSEARLAAPFAVTVTEGQDTDVVEVQIGFCVDLAACAGPLELEQVTLTLQRPDRIASVYCGGLTGSISTGIDTTLRGTCER